MDMSCFYESAAVEIRMIRNSPFVRQLAEGSLPLKCFTHYLSCDAVYLRYYAEALSLSARFLDSAGCISDARLLRSFASDGLDAELQMQDEFLSCGGIGSGAGDGRHCGRSSAFVRYGEHLLSAAEHSLEAGLAAVLPCFTVYRDTGLFIASRATADNPYRSWISTYESRDFSLQAEKMEALCGRYIGGCGRNRIAGLAGLFRRSCELELRCFEEAAACSGD